MSLNEVEKAANDAKQDFERYWERGDYYEQQGQYSQALSSYIDSLNQYSYYIFYNQANEDRIARDQGKTGIFYRVEDQISFLFSLDSHLFTINLYYVYDDNKFKKAYLAEKRKLIFKWLGENQQAFDTKTLKKYQTLSQDRDQENHLITEFQKELEAIKKTKPEQEKNEEFRKIREALRRLTETKVCPVELETSGNCFIATAAYSTSIHPDLDTFRMFRDDYLLTRPMGQKLVNFYYQVGPRLAQFVEKQPSIKRFVRLQLERLAKWMRSQGIAD